MFLQEASLDSRSPTLRSRSDTMLRAELRVFGDMSVAGGSREAPPFERPLPAVAVLAGLASGERQEGDAAEEEGGDASGGDLAVSDEELRMWLLFLR